MQDGSLLNFSSLRGGLEKVVRQKVASENGSEDKKKNGHEWGRRESCEYIDDTDRHGISRRVEW